MKSVSHLQPYPNRLKSLARQAGLTIPELSKETRIAEGTLYSWTRGSAIIPQRSRIALAKVIGCETQALAPLTGSLEENPHSNKPEGWDMLNTMPESPANSFVEYDGHFAFGPIHTTTLVLDGDGIEAYLPGNITTHVDPQPATFFEEVQRTREALMARDAAQTEGKLWNSEKYHLGKIVISREAAYEHMTLGLWFKPRDYYVGIATRKCLDDPEFRRQHHLDDWDWNMPVLGMSCSMGVDMCVVTSDNYLLLTQRGLNQSVHQGQFNCSISEALSPLLDRSVNGQKPDLYRCAARGCAEELGLHESVDFQTDDIRFLSFTVDTHYALYGLRGMVKIQKTADDLLQRWHAGVKDKRENSRLLAVPFTPEDVCRFVLGHQPFTPGGLVAIYHSLIHEFGREAVHRVLASL